MNVKELFEKAANGTLTYDEFKALADENKVKFADLSEGNYVDKNKYTDELASRDTRINTLNETITKRDSDLADLKKQLEEAGNDATKLADLTNQFSSLQTKYDNDVKTYENQLAKQKYEFAVKEIAGNEKFTSSAAKNYFIKTLDDANLAMEGENIVGVQDFITKYKAENADSFVVEQVDNPTPDNSGNANKLPTFAGPTSAAGSSEAGEQKNPFGFNFQGVR